MKITPNLVAAHDARDPRLAILMNPIHAKREIPLPVVSIKQRVEFAIRCARQVYRDPEWNRWADAWLSGVDRIAESARNAAESAGSAAESARYAAWSAESARYAAWSARSARNAAKYAAESAAESARSAESATWEIIQTALEQTFGTKAPGRQGRERRRKMTEQTTVKCLHCGATWLPRIAGRQVRCPRCDSKRWDMDPAQKKRGPQTAKAAPNG